LIASARSAARSCVVSGRGLVRAMAAKTMPRTKSSSVGVFGDRWTTVGWMSM
jgi:hypothetical protein